MLKHFRSSPLWLIGLFIIFAQGTAGVAAVKIDGWPQAALVIFVIAYSAIVTAIFFLFLWLKPENFYGPGDYQGITPGDYMNAIRGVPDQTKEAIENIGKNPTDKDALFSLLDNLITEDAKQHLVMMRKRNDQLDISKIDEMGHTHKYEIITRGKGVSFGMFSPRKFVSQIQGTELLTVSGGGDKLFLTDRGKAFCDWLIEREKDAETFESSDGFRWGVEQSVHEVMQERFGKTKPEKK